MAAGPCTTYSPIPVAPRPSEALLQEPPPPKLVPDPDTAGDTAFQLEKVEVAKYAAALLQAFRNLVAWNRGNAP